ncbi:hypothetical protein P7C71_g3099, partial [Lecanoromycetidae sp. Uapishka_2]
MPPPMSMPPPVDDEAYCATILPQIVHAHEALRTLETKVADLKAASGPSGPSVSYLWHQLVANLLLSLKWAIFFSLLLTGCFAIGFAVGTVWFGSLAGFLLWCSEKWTRFEERKKERRGLREGSGGKGEGRNEEKQNGEATGGEKKVLRLSKDVLEKCGIEIEELEELKKENVQLRNKLEELERKAYGSPEKGGDEHL